MKKTILTTAISALSLLVCAQNNTEKTKVQIGKNLLTGKSIQATRYEFGLPVYLCQFDSSLEIATLQLREITKNGKRFKNSGKIAVFNLNSKQIKWSKDFNYSQNSVEQEKNILLINNGIGSIIRIDMRNGNEMWKSEHVFFATLPDQNIALGYAYKKNTNALDDKLEGVDLTTGQKIWERKVDKKFGWNGFSLPNDSTLLIKSSGLHQINLKNGLGWNYEAATGISAYLGNLKDNEASTTFNELIATEKVSAKGYDLLNNLVSNLCTDQEKYFLASKNYLACVSKNGTIEWKTELPKETSSSYVLTDETNVYLINKGEAKYNNDKYIFGKPYFAAFDKTTGSRKCLKMLNTQGNPLNELDQRENNLKLFFGNRAYNINLKEGIVSEPVLFDKETTGKVKYAINKGKIFLQKGSSVQSLQATNPDNIFMLTDKDKVVEINSELKIESVTSVTKLYKLVGETDKYLLLSRNDQLFIADKSGKLLGLIKQEDRIFIAKNKLYQVSTQGITETDLEQITQ